MANTGLLLPLIMKVVLALGIVLVIVGGAAWLAKRAGFGGVSRRRPVLGPEVLSTTHLAPRQALHLVRVADQMVLVGASREGLTALGTFTLPRDEAPGITEAVTAAAAGGGTRPTRASRAATFLDYVEAALRHGQFAPGDEPVAATAAGREGRVATTPSSARK